MTPHHGFDRLGVRRSAGCGVDHGRQLVEVGGAEQTRGGDREEGNVDVTPSVAADVKARFSDLQF